MAVLILGTITALAVSMSTTAEPMSAHVVLAIEGGVPESSGDQPLGGDGQRSAIEQSTSVRVDHEGQVRSLVTSKEG